jgi:hypothetical protein
MVGLRETLNHFKRSRIMPVIALAVISLVLAASNSSGDGSSPSGEPLMPPALSGGLLPGGPPFIPGLFPLPDMPGCC